MTLIYIKCLGSISCSTFVFNRKTDDELPIICIYCPHCSLPPPIQVQNKYKYDVLRAPGTFQRSQTVYCTGELVSLTCYCMTRTGDSTGVLSTSREYSLAVLHASTPTLTNEHELVQYWSTIYSEYTHDALHQRLLLIWRTSTRKTRLQQRMIDRSHACLKTS
jgi:hypothetical protein